MGRFRSAGVKGVLETKRGSNCVNPQLSTTKGYPMLKKLVAAALLATSVAFAPVAALANPVVIHHHHHHVIIIHHHHHHM